mmetsp:Transcript_11858/g.35130  ORF Transcript_11858/g.35130 Transcript_11858/m.35130 type:complete len:210 (-) Transcript_11858:85-714(-)
MLQPQIPSPWARCAPSPKVAWKRRMASVHKTTVRRHSTLAVCLKRFIATSSLYTPPQLPGPRPAQVEPQNLRGEGKGTALTCGDLHWESEHFHFHRPCTGWRPGDGMRFLRPFLRRALRTRRPFFVSLRARKPDTPARALLDGPRRPGIAMSTFGISNWPARSMRSSIASASAPSADCAGDIGAGATAAHDMDVAQARLLGMNVGLPGA